MKKTIVVYQSKYGATKKYAEWLSQILKCDIIERKKCNVSLLKGYDTIVYGGGIYATGIAGISLIKNNVAQLSGKTIVVFAVGASPYEPKAFEEIKKKNMDGVTADIPLFYCRGAFYEGKMTVGDKIMIGMLKKMVGKKDPSQYETWEKALMEAAGQDGDWTSEESLQPIVKYLADKTV